MPFETLSHKKTYQSLLLILAVLMLCFAHLLHAKDLGCFGEVFEIEEESLLSFIHRKLQGLAALGTIEKYQLEIQQKAQAQVLNPKPVKGIVTAQKTKVFSYDPSVRLSQDILDEKRKVLVKKGTIINPLETVSLPRPLVFFDGDKKEQVAWVLRHFIDAKLILVRGSPTVLERTWDTHLKNPVYFDQGGVLTSKLKITAVPSVVSQKGFLLEIKELPVGASL